MTPLGAGDEQWLKHGTKAWLLALLLAGCGASPAPSAKATSPEASNPPPAAAAETEQPIPPELSEAVALSVALGRQLYILDKVAAIATDVVLAKLAKADQATIAGYLPMQEGDERGQPTDSFLVSFFTTDDPPRVAYEVRVKPGASPEFRALAPPQQADPGFLTLVRAREVAIASIPHEQPINPVLLPGEVIGASGILVYLLAGTKTPHVAVFGRHFRALVPINGSKVASLTPLSNSILEIPTRGPNGETIAALVVTHVVTDYPLETHVFTSLLAKLPVYVGTKRGTWRVDAGKITFLGDWTPGNR